MTNDTNNAKENIIKRNLNPGQKKRGEYIT